MFDESEPQAQQRIACRGFRWLAQFVRYNPVMQSAPSHSTPADHKPSLDDCEAVIIQFAPPEVLTYIVVWRNRPRYVRPVERGKRIRDLQSGDAVVFRGKSYVVSYVVHSLEVYR
jgi:hypothetical protein